MCELSCYKSISIFNRNPLYVRGTVLSVSLGSMSCSITRHPFGLVFPRMTVLMRKRASDSLLHCGHFEFRVAMVEFSNRSSLYSSQQIFGLSDGILRILTLSIKSQHFKGSLAILFLKLSSERDRSDIQRRGN